MTFAPERSRDERFLQSLNAESPIERTSELAKLTMASAVDERIFSDVEVKLCLSS